MTLHSFLQRHLAQPLAVLGLLAAGLGTLPAAIVIPGADGSDGALNITNNTVIDLSQAVTGPWDTNNAANAGRGVYDPAKWAVVFKYTEVTVAAGATVTFKNHDSRAPVVWLVSGNVTINGTVSLDGQRYQNAPHLAEPGPGGFRGGMGTLSGGVEGSAGFGIGGGPGGGITVVQAPGGSYSTLGGNISTTVSPAAPYGNPSLIPLIGGSGGGGSGNYLPHGGGGGGGAIAIACGGVVTVNGTVQANGGPGLNDPVGNALRSGSGSGGGIRVICDVLRGGGTVRCLGGVGGNTGGLGRVRIERVTNTNSISVTPDPSVVDLAPGGAALIWPPEGAPEVRIVSIGNQNAPANPRAEFGTIGADTVLPLTSSTQILIETINVEQASQVKVRCTPRTTHRNVEVNAAVSSVVSTNPLVVRWAATLPVNAGYSAVQVKVIRP